MNLIQRGVLVIVLAICCLLFAAIFAGECHADIRVNLLSRLNQYMDDAGNTKMSQANKVLFLNAIGKEFGRLGFYLKRDTVITVASTELYAANSDFAGMIHAAYAKVGDVRTVVRVVPRDSVFLAPPSASRSTTFMFVEDNANYGIDPLPIGVDTFIVIYHAHPAALTGDSTEWSLADDAEDAALQIVASRCLMKLPTVWASERSLALEASGWRVVARMMNPESLTRQVGDSPR